jgi:hypothetical protein
LLTLVTKVADNGYAEKQFSECLQRYSSANLLFSLITKPALLTRDCCKKTRGGDFYRISGRQHFFIDPQKKVVLSFRSGRMLKNQCFYDLFEGVNDDAENKAGIRFYCFDPAGCRPGRL